LATYAIATIGLREPPLANMKLTIYAYDPECTSRWKTTRAWYQEVKAGKRTFSFRGQPVEYRFKPDGTWETIALRNPPDDAITYTRPTTAKTPDTAALLPTNKNAAHKESLWWNWLIGVFSLIFAFIVWRIIGVKRKQA
jgi:hypothetical protein